MTQHEFINALRVLNNIDRDDVPFLSTNQWVIFCNEPDLFLMRCDDATADVIWAVIQQRSESKG